MHLAQVVSFVSLCATRTWKNWKTPSTLKLSLTECAGVDYDYKSLRRAAPINVLVPYHKNH